jgi:cobyrinic acid a,c-diamide synthase
VKAIVIGGTVSGVGKTTVTLGLMGVLGRHHIKVQPFKTGPDYIDPSHHTRVTGEPSRNLDTWMLPPEAVIELFTRAMAGKDMAVIEGVMGLYDGQYSTREEGSTAELAKLLGVPVILVLDSRNGARSLAAMVTGYKTFDPGVNLVGVILNGIGSDVHLKLCREAVEHYTNTPVLGYLPQSQNLSLPERHLGLIPATEQPADQEFLDRLITQCESTFNLPEILRLSETATPPGIEPNLFPSKCKASTVRIGVARDKAFSFYYQDNLDLLQAWGAEIVPFSPMQDATLPEGIAGLYIGGGFPEIYAAELAGNFGIKKEIEGVANLGMPVYAECGGLMYLGKSIRDFQGKEYPMVGVISISSHIDKHRLSLGYRTVEALADGPLLRKGQIVRGHEFHWSVLEDNGVLPNAYSIVDKDGQLEGYQRRGLLASYIHLHFGSLPSLAIRFIETCSEFAERRKF